MEATEILSEEHQVIKRVLKVLQQAARDIGNGKQHPPALFEQAVDFIRNFADKCHHAKEQDILFKEMEKLGIPVQGGPIGMMLLEHDQGRAFTKAMADAVPGYGKGDGPATKALADSARNYANLLAQHIDKEDNILYPMANLHLDEKGQANLKAQFDKVEAQMGAGVHERYHRMVAELETQVLGHSHEASHH